MLNYNWNNDDFKWALYGWKNVLEARQKNVVCERKKGC